MGEQGSGVCFYMLDVRCFINTHVDMLVREWSINETEVQRNLTCGIVSI